MAWLEITLLTAGKDVESVAAALTARGFDDLVIEDQAEMERFLEDNRAYWDYIDEALQKKLQGLSQIRLYLPSDDCPSLAALEGFAEERGLTLTKNPLPDTDWEEDWKSNYPPQTVGSRFLVLPYWLSDTSTQGRLPVVLDPGLTFGTGAHPSTQMVMEAMETAVKPGMTCLDLGSGSGILSIAALRLGAKRAVGVDIDPKAEDAARENAGYNGYSVPEFTALTGNVLEDHALMEHLASMEADVVLVNIVADVIIALAPVLPKLLKGESTLILSGILDTRLPEVIAAVERAGLRVLAVRAKEDWRCVTAGWKEI